MAGLRPGSLRVAWLLSLAASAAICSVAAPPATAATEPASWPASAAPAPNRPQLYLLSFLDQEITEVTGQVVGVILQTPFEVDPAISGTMTLVIEERLTRAELRSRFEAALALSGARLIERNGALRLVPRALPSALNLRAPPAGRRRDGEVVSAAVRNGAVSSLAGAPPMIATPAVKASRTPLSVTIGVVGLAAFSAALLGLAVLMRKRGFAVGLTRARAAFAALPREAVLARLCEGQGVAPATLAAAQTAAARSGRPVEHVLNGMGAISDEALVEAYAAVTGLPVWRPEDQPACLRAEDLGMPAETLARRGLVPVHSDGAVLTLATSDPLDDVRLAAVAVETARTVTILVCTPADVRRAIAAV